MFQNSPFETSSLERMARDSLEQWGAALRQAGLGGGLSQPPQMWPGMQAASAATSGFAAGASAQRQADDWFSLMQNLASRFAGREASAADIGQAWREALGANAADPFASVFTQWGAQGLSGLENWLQQVLPGLNDLQEQASRWFNMPAFGLTREHQGRWQQLRQALQEYQRWANDYHALMTKAGQHALALFETKLEAHAEPGRQIASARALFDVWIDAAEEAYAQIALSPEFRHIYGQLANAQMRVRAGVQKEVEQVSALFGMPTRTEVDSAYRKIVELERAMRRLNRQVGPQTVVRATPAASTTGEAPTQSKPAPKTRAPGARRRVAKQAAAAGAPRKAAAKAPAPAKRAAAERAVAPAAKTTAPAAARRATSPKVVPAKSAPAKTAKAAKPLKAAGKTSKAARKSVMPAVEAPVSMRDWVSQHASGKRAGRTS
ncbi:class III poly(R)-hydroxyalkanoic acid synthase subunit PhaE [Pseudoxanthomonas composti]|uniref:Poly(3-hydroxyalkanoate) polymerase subunit PhaE n=1 Tax=Pseudoxanthomonas composti TaxID=2137479 RepID=A0A4Q1JWK1_9GAMM|nr:class III poly(R)-hydroxyalkanoic acid synthase subunit PhaE [Pseudoxanthomonas composti]RXR06991.1 class III poly(R)-hydroxyalkanoic acid synthase subunit PhaE [Pseudoxanthomonas composti]